MFFFLSKFLPLFLYPLGLASLLMLAALLLARRQRWQRAALLFALLTLWLGSNRWVATGLARSLEWRHLPDGPLPSVDAIVVLGGGTHAQEPPRPLVEVSEAGDRLLYAAELYEEGKAPVILVTGGVLPYSRDPMSEAERMTRVLARLGVPREAIWLETKAINTHENGVFSRDILRDAGVEEVLLVTSAMHMPRAMGVFENLGLAVTAAPADFTVTANDWQALWRQSLLGYLLNLVPDANNVYVTQLALKEYLGILVYGMRGWL